MLRIVKKGHSHFLYNREMNVKSLISLILFAIICLSSSIISEVKYYYGRIESCYEVKKFNKNDNPSYKAVINFDELSKQLTFDVDQKYFDSAYNGKVVKYEMNIMDEDNTYSDFLIASLVISFGVWLVYFSLALFLILKYFIYIIKNYVIRCVDKKEWKFLKKIDPYLEEDWKS